MIGRAQFALLSLLLSSCASPDTDPRIDEAPLNDESRGQARAYFSKPNAKAFAFEPETGTNWHAWGASSVEEARQIALSQCEEKTARQCILFAVNDEILWQPDAAGR